MNKIIKIDTDGFVWKIVNGNAKEIFNSELFDLYELLDEGSERLIETIDELNLALENGIDIGIEVGYIK